MLNTIKEGTFIGIEMPITLECKVGIDFHMR